MIIYIILLLFVILFLCSTTEGYVGRSQYCNNLTVKCDAGLHCRNNMCIEHNTCVLDLSTGNCKECERDKATKKYAGCPDGSSCVNRQCMTYEKCKKTKECPSDRKCSMGYCIKNNAGSGDPCRKKRSERVECGKDLYCKRAGSNRFGTCINDDRCCFGHTNGCGANGIPFRPC